ncbi:MAG: hypothetical protein NZ899_09645 [Thermoguttaceae bacterium]|nr:hypothetical protein [Thermoguttaceae bacterium]MDW8077606.1 hypothetical protein [Thermoguttaceae bacterium]
MGALLTLLAINVSFQSLLITMSGGPAPDALRMIALAQEIQSEGVDQALRRQGSEPVYPILLASIHAFRSWLVGDWVDWAFSSQLTAAGGAVLSCLLVYMTIARLLGPSCGLASGLLFCVLPEMARLGPDGIADPIGLAFAAGSIYCLVRFGEAVRNKRALLSRLSLPTGTSLRQRGDLTGVDLGKGSALTYPCRKSSVIARRFLACRAEANSEELSWAFLAGLLAALGAMSHRAGLILVTFGLVFFSSPLVLPRMTAWARSRMRRTCWQEIAESFSFVDEKPSFGADVGRLHGGGKTREKDGWLFPSASYRARIIGCWTLGALSVFVPYWLILRPQSVSELVGSLVNDVLTKAPYPHWPAERGPIPAGTHSVQDPHLPAVGQGKVVDKGKLVDTDLAAGLIPTGLAKCFLRESFAYRPASPEPTLRWIFRRPVLAVQELADAFGYLLAVPALVGALALRKLCRPQDLLLRYFVAFYLVACLFWVWKYGYIAARHFGPVVIVGIGPAAWSVLQVGRCLGRRGGYLAVGLITCLLGVDALTAIPNQVALSSHEAATYLASQKDQTTWVADWLGYAGLWSRRPMICVDDLWAYVDQPQVGYVVVQETDLHRNTWRAEVLRALLDAGGEKIAAFSSEEAAKKVKASLPWWLRWIAFSGRIHLFRPSDPEVVAIYRWHADRWQSTQDAVLFSLSSAASRHGVNLASRDLVLRIYHQAAINLGEQVRDRTLFGEGFRRR